jgi:arylsulfatase A-like enzyme
MPSLLTGRYFSEVSRIEQKWPHILPDNVMLAEMVKDAGYQTWAKASFGYFIPYFGYGQGFDKFDDSIPREGRVHWLRTSARVTDRTLEAIDDMRATPESPFFVMAHYADPHSGYMHHKESPRFGPNISDLYDEEIFFTDLHLGRLFEGLEERGLMDDTIIVVTADHGEGLHKKQDHDHLYHGQTLYDELIHVPLIIHAPFAEPRRIDRPVALIDVVPTLLDATGVGTDSLLRGFSLVPYLRGDAGFERPPVFSQKGQPQWKELAAMVDWPWKAIWKVRTNRFELYRLDRDPHEVADLAMSQPARMTEMASHMRAWRASLDPPQVFSYGK